VKCSVVSSLPSEGARMSVPVVPASHQVSVVVPHSGHIQRQAMLNSPFIDSRLVSVGLATDSPPSAVACLPLVSHGPSSQHFTELNVMPVIQSASSQGVENTHSSPAVTG